MFHVAADENSRECLKLLVNHFKVDPDEPDFVRYNNNIIIFIIYYVLNYHLCT